jgi:hypothetical protein
MVAMSWNLIPQMAAPLLAQSGSQNYSPSWALVVFCVFLGVSVALLPAKRTSEIKRPRED